jgi:hypothetical protein
MGEEKPLGKGKIVQYTYKPVPMGDVEFADISLPRLLKPGYHTNNFGITTFPKKTCNPLIRLPGNDGQHIIGWELGCRSAFNIRHTPGNRTRHGPLRCKHVG